MGAKYQKETYKVVIIHVVTIHVLKGGGGGRYWIQYWTGGRDSGSASGPRVTVQGLQSVTLPTLGHWSVGQNHYNHF